jgi:hypothetical protein
MPDENALRDRLKEAISNSRKKKYHGNSDNMNELPKISDQAKILLEEKGTPFTFYDEEKKQFLEAGSPKWA